MRALSNEHAMLDACANSASSVDRRSRLISSAQISTDQIGSSFGAEAAPRPTVKSVDGNRNRFPKRSGKLEANKRASSVLQTSRRENVSAR
jgi:hypothetical protein